jgi:hypothetical protein
VIPAPDRSAGQALPGIQKKMWRSHAPSVTAIFSITWPSFPRSWESRKKMERRRPRLQSHPSLLGAQSRSERDCDLLHHMAVIPAPDSAKATSRQASWESRPFPAQDQSPDCDSTVRAPFRARSMIFSSPRSQASSLISRPTSHDSMLPLPCRVSFPPPFMLPLSPFLVMRRR